MKKLAIIFGIFLFTSPCFAGIYYSKQEAMELAFGESATVKMMPIFLSKEQISSIQKLARVKVDSAMFTFYVGRVNDKILGYAAIESHIVRTKPETILIVLSPEGKLRQIEMLAFHEPPEYQPPANWFKQLLNKTIAQLDFNTGVQAITGATLSSRAAIKSARKVVATFQIAIENSSN